ncbi:MAG: 5-formyltetrahydrofolate cyclo-ligase [Alphaproteobacteria bacterium]|nr:5-formyltetrahydrofolate cyclo-ligase [Alphaproteobacteria bacterium SS10]
MDMEAVVQPLTTNLLELVAGWDGPRVVSGYWPIRGEIDSRPIMAGLIAAGHQITLPVVVARERPMIFRRWTPDTEMIKGDLPVYEPEPDAPELLPDTLLIPMLAFDQHGFRLGMGGGFYDRTVPELRKLGPVTLIGLAHHAQQGEDLPREPHDVPLDWIVTDQGAMSFASKADG